MDWWNVGVTIVTLVAAGGAGMVVLCRLIRSEFGALRKESRKAHEKIEGRIADLRKELGDGIVDLARGFRR